MFRQRLRAFKEVQASVQYRGECLQCMWWADEDNSLASFNRWEDQAFLKSGPRHLDPSGYDALFKGIETIENLRGEYRPITLGIVLICLNNYHRIL